MLSDLLPTNTWERALGRALTAKHGNTGTLSFLIENIICIAEIKIYWIHFGSILPHCPTYIFFMLHNQISSLATEIISTQ